MVLKNKKQEIRKYWEDEGYDVFEDDEGQLIVETNKGRREYDSNGEGGYTLSSGPCRVYVDKFGNT